MSDYRTEGLRLAVYLPDAGEETEVTYFITAPNWPEACSKEPMLLWAVRKEQRAYRGQTIELVFYRWARREVSEPSGQSVIEIVAEYVQAGHVQRPAAYVNRCAARVVKNPEHVGMLRWAGVPPGGYVDLDGGAVHVQRANPVAPVAAPPVSRLVVGESPPKATPVRVRRSRPQKPQIRGIRFDI